MVQFRIKLNNRGDGFVPVRRIENKSLAFHQFETAITRAEADIFTPAFLALEIHDDFLFRFLGKREIN